MSYSVEGDIVVIIYLCVQTWWLFLVVCLDTVSVVATGACACARVCVCLVCVFHFSLERENDILDYQLQEVQGLLHFI